MLTRYVLYALLATLLASCRTYLDDDESGRIPSWTDLYGEPTDTAFSGILSFAHLPYYKCLSSRDYLFDIGIVGFPFDTAVTYRPGARFGPHGIRSGQNLSSRLLVASPRPRTP